MSAKGEYFISDLTEVARKYNVIEGEEEVILKSKYCEMWRNSDIPLEGTVKVDGLEGEESTMDYEAVLVEDEIYIKSLTRRGQKTQIIDWHKRSKGDWVHQLQPIVLDLLDGEPKLTKEDVDYLMPILRAKIEFFNGLITKEEYETILNNTDN